MTVEILTRSRDAVIHCNRCRNTLHTGQIQKTPIREYAKSVGWIRGLRTTKIVDPATRHLPPPERTVLPPNLKHDICPTCAPAERYAAETRKQAADDRRKARTKRRAAWQPGAIA